MLQRHPPSQPTMLRRHLLSQPTTHQRHLPSHLIMHPRPQLSQPTSQSSKKLLLDLHIKSLNHLQRSQPTSHPSNHTSQDQHPKSQCSHFLRNQLTGNLSHHLRSLDNPTRLRNRPTVPRHLHPSMYQHQKPTISHQSSSTKEWLHQFTYMRSLLPHQLSQRIALKPRAVM